MEKGANSKTRVGPVGGRRTKKISTTASRHVSFLKRRNSLVKKANELCILSGSSVAVIAFSPGGKAFSYGNPCLEAVIDRFLGRFPHSAELESSSPPELEAMCDSLLQDIAVEEHHRDLQEAEFRKLCGGSRAGMLWDCDTREDVKPEEREEFVVRLTELKAALKQQVANP